jgi:ligand-binding sensor domain-containing protein/signal transduction histidine kinase
MYRYLLIWLLGATLVSVNCIGQKNQLRFKHLTIDDGLSQNSITCIIQDKMGFMWIGTHDGLNRFDGYEFIQFRNQRNNPNSISNNFIWDIHEDKDGLLWIATFGGGLNSFDPVSGHFRRYQPIPGDSTSFPSNRLFSITETDNGVLWIGGNEGLIRFEKATGKSDIFLAHNTFAGTYADHYIGQVAAAPDEQLWLRSDSGLALFNTQTLSVSFFARSPFSKEDRLGEIYDILIRNNTMLVACDAGLLSVDLSLKTDTLLLSSLVFVAGQQAVTFKKLLVSGPDQYIIGTSSGVILYNSHSNQTSIYQSNASDIKSLTHNNIFSLFKSNDGIVWIGTRNGLNLIESEKPNFIHISKIAGEQGLSSNNVNSFVDDNDNLLWVSTTEGLNVYNKSKDIYESIRKSPETQMGLLSDYMLCLFQDSKGNKWAGTREGGLYRIDYGHSSGIRLQQVQPTNIDASSSIIHFITESSDGMLWIGTGGEGLWKYNPNDNTVKQFMSAKDGTGPNHPFIFSILPDRFNNLWLGTPTGGLNLFNPQTEEFLYFQHKPDKPYSLSNDIVLSLHADSQNHIWVGTNGGLNRLIYKTGDTIFQYLKAILNDGDDSLFANFGQQQGFPNDVIYGMLEDGHKNLWCSTNKGLVKFDLDTEKVIKAFDVSDGLQSNEFNRNGYYKGADGRFYFGGVNGFNVFHPDSITDNTFVPPVVITSMSLFNEPVRVASDVANGKYVLEKAIQYLDRIDLSWKENFITFSFSALSYKSPDKNRFSFMLEGFNNEWIQAGSSRSATFTHLPPGRYVFKVRACNNSGVWNEEGTALQIFVSTPPWLSWYAYLIYSLIFLGLVYSFVRYRIGRATREFKIQAQIEKARSQEREAFRKKSAADFHDEAGNKITKISLFTELARTEMNDTGQLRKYLDKIQLNVTELSAGMRDFLWVLNPQHDSLFETVSRLKDFGDSILTETGIKFTISGMHAGFSKIALPMNTRRDMLQIFKEAMTNCAKYAEASQVILSIKLDEDKVELSLTDNGKGFDTGKVVHKNSYGLSIMHERANNIGARLSIESSLNQGTVITLKYNIPHMGNSI